MTLDELYEKVMPLYYELHDAAGKAVSEPALMGHHNDLVQRNCRGAWTLCDGGGSPDMQAAFQEMPHIYLLGGANKIGTSINKVLDVIESTDEIVNALAVQVAINGEIIDTIEEYKGGMS